ncbi:hairy/enhancer-of-split related with YRPW motif protein-like [Lineus longissimus]|uniref:hairy/enhancer-of-split related with YRPW motif protein-like n=1 Tax=Lineus longissimus TaxID=88925 RepID=UPI002B4EE17A
MDINRAIMDSTRRHQDIQKTPSDETTTRDIFSRRRPGIGRRKREPRSEPRRRQRPSQDTDPPCRVRNGRVGRRTRDRINTSLDDLMMLVPADKINQQSPQTGKTDIIDLAVQHIKELHAHVTTENLENAENEPQGTDSPDGAMRPPAANFLADLPPLGESDVIHAGFQDCTEQTIQYLLQVENMSIEDPIIMGLRQHLARKRLVLDCEVVVENEPLRTNDAEMCNFLSNNVYPSASGFAADDTHDDTSSSAHGACASPQRDSVCVDGFDEVDGASNRHTNSNENNSFSDMSAADDSEDSNSPSASNTNSYPFEQLLTEGDGRRQEEIDDLKLLEQLPNLTVLAQSNPAIAQLAGHILSMIEEDEDPVG